jgi:hypothetical protein
MTMTVLQPKKAQRLIVGGSLQPLPAGDNVDPTDHYKLQELTKRLLAGVSKHLRKDLAVELAGHGLGGVAAVLLVPRHIYIYIFFLLPHAVHRH